MRRFFKKISDSSVVYAKNRLKTVINNDRINITQSKTLEKIRKEVLAVLVKYSSEDEGTPQVSITCPEGAKCVLAAQFNSKESYLR